MTAASADLLARRTAAKRSRNDASVAKPALEIPLALQTLALERRGIAQDLLAGRIDKKTGQRWIGIEQPPAKCDAVGLVDDAIRIQGVEIAEHGLAQQIGVQGGDAVDLMRSEECEIAHPDAPSIMLVDQ